MDLSDSYNVNDELTVKYSHSRFTICWLVGSTRIYITSWAYNKKSIKDDFELACFRSNPSTGKQRVIIVFSTNRKRCSYYSWIGAHNPIVENSISCNQTFPSDIWFYNIDRQKLYLCPTLQDLLFETLINYLETSFNFAGKIFCEFWSR